MSSRDGDDDADENVAAEGDEGVDADGDAEGDAICTVLVGEGDDADEVAGAATVTARSEGV